MSEPIRSSVTRDEVLLRIFFGNFASKTSIRREIESYLDRIRHERTYLESTEARVNAHPGRKHEARRFQLLSLRLKVAQYRAMEQELVEFLGDGATAAAANRRITLPSRASKKKPSQGLARPRGQPPA